MTANEVLKEMFEDNSDNESDNILSHEDIYMHEDLYVLKEADIEFTEEVIIRAIFLMTLLF